MNDKKEGVGKMLLIPYIEKVIETLKADRKLPAVRTYTATKNSFMRFCQAEGVTMQVAEVFTAGRLKQYENWLRGRNAEWNTVSTYMRTLKAVHNRLVDAKVAAYDKKLFGDVYTRVESQTKRALTEGQMNTLLHADFETLPAAKQCVPAYFLLMFMFHGMPFIDLAYLRKKDLRGDCIVYCRHKTGRQITVRIPHQAKALLEKFRNKDSNSIYLFPILEGQPKAGKTEDAEQLYALYEKALGRFNRTMAQVASLLLPGVAISSYTARHTWATLAFYAGIPLGIISKALGHSSIKVTDTYLKPFENEKVDVANDELIGAVVRYEERESVA